MLLDCNVHYLQSKDNYLYFASNYQQADYYIFKMKDDGTQLTQLNNMNSEYLNISGDWLYYVGYVPVDDSHVYSKVFKMKLDGTENSMVFDESISYRGIIVSSEWIYYLAWREIDYTPDGPCTYQLCRRSLDGSVKEELADEVLYFSVDGDNLYYSDGYSTLMKLDLISNTNSIMEESYDKNMMISNVDINIDQGSITDWSSIQSKFPVEDANISYELEDSESFESNDLGEIISTESNELGEN